MIFTVLVLEQEALISLKWWSFSQRITKENATQAAISGHMSATLLQRRGVHNNEAAKRNFN